MSSRGGLFRDEQGFTTTSMVLSLLVTLSLLFASAQVYRVQSASAEVQDVADAAALSGEGQVAEFMLVARFCDAVVLSMTLSGLVVTGLGIAALCTPFTAELSGTLIDTGKSIIKARDAFSKRASSALGKLQEALPYFAAACAASVAQANDSGSQGASYIGVAMLVPSEGEPIRPSTSDAAEKVVEDTEEKADEIKDDAKRAEEAAKEAEESKQRAFAHDCGDNPDYCMYERARSLAGMSGASNPLYESVDAWSFSVPLERAKRYYAARYASESVSGESVREQARSALRKRFYRFASQEMEDGYVYEDEDSFDAYFPLLPRNTSEMRETELYTEQVYPITVDETEIRTETEVVTEVEGELVFETVVDVQTEKHYVMHAWSGCPRAGSPSSYGSIRSLDSGGYETCPLCEFTVQSMGKVAAASTSIRNGFEYHYRAVADEARAFEKAFNEAQRPKEEVKKSAGQLVEELVDAMRESAQKRIDARPPGGYGAIAFVVNTGETPAAGRFTSGFVSATGSLGPRAALSAATLVDEGSDEGKTVLNSALDGIREGGGLAVGAAGIALDAWSFLVMAYSDGQQAIADALSTGLDAIPLVGSSGLGPWAAEKLRSAIEAVGLEPAEVGALKPVLVNSAHVAGKGGDQTATLLSVKRRVVSAPLMSTDLFSSALTQAERAAVSKVEGLGDTVEVASIELLGEGGPTIPITIPLPEGAKTYGVAFIQGLFGRIRSFYFQTTGVRVWE